MTITDAEINITFSSGYPFRDYLRTLLLMEYVMRTKNNKSVTGIFYNGVDDRSIPETFYILDKKTIKVKCYDKEQEINNKLGTKYYNGYLVRMEINVNGQNLRRKLGKRLNDNVLYLADITEDSVENYFISFFADCKLKIDNFLNKELSYLYSMDVDRSGGVKIFLMQIEGIMTQALEFSNIAVIEKLLAPFYFEEIRTNIPRLLDIQDFIEAIETSNLLNKHVKRDLLEAIDNIVKKSSNEMIRYFIDQREKYEYFWHKILNSEEHKIYVQVES